ncbi:unnamed protein product [Albugo candida]|uniref:Uncharacterized protein n=1 Tax=Albugo candida TaxID=65357 RepID=A0A024G4V2_9STRA|nr:unnamed protein product [Albugo candida]|eukprot:CCI41786.1 unnamed protein product [Albugo candida]
MCALNRHLCAALYTYNELPFATIGVEMTQLFVADLLASVLHDRHGMMRILGACTIFQTGDIGEEIVQVENLMCGKVKEYGNFRMFVSTEWRKAGRKKNLETAHQEVGDRPLSDVRRRGQGSKIIKSHENMKHDNDVPVFGSLKMRRMRLISMLSEMS